MKLSNKKGFTLMEMLIVVAIIAVLVAIAIPTFANQLEKAREASDAANIRSAYAEVMVAAIDGDTANLPVGVTVDSTGCIFSKTVELQQTKDTWQTATIKEIGGFDVTGLQVGKGKSVTVSFNNATLELEIKMAN